MGFKGYKFHGRVTVNPNWVGKSFASSAPSCFMHEALRTGLVSNFSICVCVGGGGGGGLYGPRPQFLRRFKNV